MDATGNGVPVTQYYGCWVVDFYNDERPHEALDQETPGSIYQASRRELPRTLRPLEYPGHFDVRLVSRNSGKKPKSGGYERVSGGLAWHSLSMERCAMAELVP